MSAPIAALLCPSVSESAHEAPPRARGWCMNRVILDLCAGSGAWSEPYREAGYMVVRVTLPQDDVRRFEWIKLPVHGIIAAPPCTVFAASGYRWPRSDEDMMHALSVVDAFLRAVAIYGPEWWALENPVGRLSRWLGPPTLSFDPCDYGDSYTKRTLLWGRFNRPKPASVVPERINRIHHMPESPDRAAKRGITPPGFARAFFEANP